MHVVLSSTPQELSNTFKNSINRDRKTTNRNKIAKNLLAVFFGDQIMDVNIRSMDVNTRKPFGLRSDYVQITFEGVQIAFDLRKYYGYIAYKNRVF